MAADEYQVSYQQVYGWVRKYELDDPDGLVDRRGQKLKPSGYLSEFDRLEEALKAEQRNSRRLQMENDYLKRLNEIERVKGLSLVRQQAEYYYRKRFDTLSLLESDLTQFIQYYNERRITLKFNGLAPLVFRRNYLAAS